MSQIDIGYNKKFQQNHKTDFMWYVVLPDLSSSASAGTLFSPNLPTSTSLIKSDEISHRVFSIDTPFDAFEVKKNDFGSTFWYSATHVDIGSLTLNVDEMDDGLTLKYFTDWQKLIKNPNGTHNPPAFYKRNVIFYQLNKAGQPIKKSTYMAYFPNEIQPFSWSNDGNAVTQYSITLTGDSVKHEDINNGV